MCLCIPKDNHLRNAPLVLIQYTFPDLNFCKAGDEFLCTQAGVIVLYANYFSSQRSRWKECVQKLNLGMGWGWDERNWGI